MTLCQAQFYLLLVIADQCREDQTEMPQKAPRHHLQRTRLQRRRAKQNSASHWAPRRPPDHSKATQTEMAQAHNNRYLQGLPRQSCRAQYKEGELDRKRDGRTTSWNGWA